jgi:hypothetical protein
VQEARGKRGIGLRFVGRIEEGCTAGRQADESDGLTGCVDGGQEEEEDREEQEDAVHGFFDLHDLVMVMACSTSSCS